MALVTRGTRSYAYKSVRKDGRVTSVYRASGATALAIGLLESEDREAERRQRAEERDRRAQIEAEDAPIVEMHQAVEKFARAALIASGHHQHHRSEWRRRRKVKTEVAKTVDLIKRAQNGDQSTRQEVRAFLQREVDLLTEYEMGHLTDVKLSKMGAGDNVLVQEVRLREIRKNAAELAGPDPTPLERLLAHRVAVCQVAVQHAEYRLAQQADSGESVTLTYMEYLERRITAAHRRLLQAAKMLATVHKFQVPGASVTVNVNQTTNVEARAAESTRLDVPTLLGIPSRG